MRANRVAGVLAVSVLLALAVGCKPASPRYVDEGGAYDRKSVMRLLSSIGETKGLAETPVSQATEGRHQAMSALRAGGGSAANAAELMTRVFPPATAAVPYYVESASYEGTSAVVILEAMGRKGGNLSDKRLWVISLDGDVLISASR